MRLQHLLTRARMPFADDAIVHAEVYFPTISVVGIATSGLLLLWLGNVLSHMIGTRWLGALGQASVLLVWGQLSYCLTKLNAESVLFPLSLAMTLTSLYAVVAKASWARYSSAALLGVLGALGLVTKLNFIPVLLLPVFVIRGILPRLTYIAVSAGSTALLIQILGSEREVFIAQLKRYVFRTGIHGQGGTGLLPANVEAIIVDLVRTEPWFFGVLAVGACAAVVGGLRWVIQRREEMVPSWRALAALVLVAVVQAAAVVRSPLAYYLMPVFGFLVAIVPLTVCQLTPNYAIIRRLVGVLLLAVILWGTGERALRGFKASYRMQRELRLAAASISGYLSLCASDATWIYDKAVPLPLTAHHFGNDSCGRRQSERLMRLYPNAYFYHPWGGSYHTWDQPISFSKIWLENPVIYLVGPTNYHEPARAKLIAPSLPLEPLTNIAFVGLYRVVTNLLGHGAPPRVSKEVLDVLRWIDQWYVNTQLYVYGECTNLINQLRRSGRWDAVKQELLGYGQFAATVRAFMEWETAKDEVARESALGEMRATVTDKTWPFYLTALMASPPATRRAYLLPPDELVSNVFGHVHLWDGPLVWFARMYREQCGPEEAIAYWRAVARQWPTLRGAAAVNILGVLQETGEWARGVDVIRENIRAIATAEWTKQRARDFLQRANLPETRELYQQLVNYETEGGRQ